MVAPRGVCGCFRGHVWDMTRYGDTVNERAVRILLECILVLDMINLSKKCVWQKFKGGYMSPVVDPGFPRRALIPELGAETYYLARCLAGK